MRIMYSFWKRGKDFDPIRLAMYFRGFCAGATGGFGTSVANSFITKVKICVCIVNS